MDTIVGAVVALAAVALTALFTRRHEKESWRREQLVDAVSLFVLATSAVEQWGAPQWASQLKGGQHPTEYKHDLQQLDAALARLQLVAPQPVTTAALQVHDDLFEYLTRCTDAAVPPRLGLQMMPMMSREQAQAYDAREAARRADRDKKWQSAEGAQLGWRQSRDNLLEVAARLHLT